METENQDNILNNYYESIIKQIENDNELAQEILSDSGLDIESESTKAELHIRRLKTQLMAKIRRENFQHALNILAEIKNQTKEKIQNLLKKPEFAAVVPLFNKLDKVSESDLQSMIDDVELLNILDKLKKESDLNNE